MIQTVQRYQELFKNSPRDGWMDGRFYLISAGRSMKRVYSPTCADLPMWADKKPGCPQEAIDNIEKRRKEAAADLKAKEEYQLKLKKERVAALRKKVADAGPHDFTPTKISPTFCSVCDAPQSVH